MIPGATTSPDSPKTQSSDDNKGACFEFVSLSLSSLGLIRLCGSSCGGGRKEDSRSELLMLRGVRLRSVLSTTTTAVLLARERAGGEWGERRTELNHVHASRHDSPVNEML